MRPKLENALINIAFAGDVDRFKVPLASDHGSLSKETVDYFLDAAAKAPISGTWNFFWTSAPLLV